MRLSLGSLSAALLLAAGFATSAGAQPTFSVDVQGPTAATPLLDGFLGSPISDGDILTHAAPGPPGPNPELPGPLPPPGIEVGAAVAAVGVVAGGLGVAPSLFGCFEVDALSYGFDAGDALYFSVDEYATGLPGPSPPNVFSEGSAGLAEASADVFRYLGSLVPSAPGPGPGNTAHIDGDGLAPSGLPGLGLLEPNPPTIGVLPDVGDNLDALDLDTVLPFFAGPIFFSLDAAFPDIFEPTPPVNCGTAAASGFSGADVLVTFPGAAPVLAVPGLVLGLDLGGFGTDDLDALMFADADGSLTLTLGDTLFFSVRRGSAVIGALDSTFGAPIEEGDILMPPPAAGLPPSIFIAAENLGLGTLRTGSAGPFGPDDLDALDVAPSPPPPSVTVPALGAWGVVALIAALATGPALGLGSRRKQR